MWNLVEYLKQPSLVAQVQAHFGVKGIPTNSKTSIKGQKEVEVFDETNNFQDKPKNNLTGLVSEDYVIQNKFWYYLFLVGTSLGDEIFYASFIPFWFWNIDGAVGRRVVFVWTIVMYIGQGVKDIIKWPRPSHPAKRLQKKWAEEYGMPSTHAMVSVSIPFSIIIFTVNRYIYSLTLGITLALIWCTVICISRVYLGMHTVLDIIAGLFLSFLLMLPMVPMVDYLDSFWLSSTYSPVILFAISFAAIYFFPTCSSWTPTRGDTTMIASVCAGIHIGAWTNFNLGNMTPYPYPPPYKILWPNQYMLGLGLLRTVLGFSLVFATRNIVKSFVINALSFTCNTTPEHVKQKNSDKKSKDIFIELATIYSTYFMIGFNTIYTIPIAFRFLGIERPTFYTEI